MCILRHKQMLYCCAMLSKRYNYNMQMRNRWITFFVLQSVLSALWAVGFVRAQKFYIYTQSASKLLGSANAAGDFRFSQHILFCYIVSFVIGLLLIWLFCEHRHPIFVFSVVCTFLIVLSIIASKPESVIVFFPSLMPYIALLGSVALGIICLIARFIISHRMR